MNNAATDFSSDNKFERLLRERGVLLADGATGTNLFDAGLEAGYPPELWNEEQPEKIVGLHKGFTDAGADIILTNTFGGNACRLKLHDADKRVFEINKKGAEIARSVADNAGRPVIVAGSVGPTGEILEPVGALSYTDAVQAFKEQAEGLKAGGADIAWIETMSAENEAQAALEGAHLAGLRAVLTMSFDTAGRTMMGITPEGFGKDSTMSYPVKPAAVGANCGTGASELVATVIGIAKQAGDTPIVAKGNCGIPHFVDGECTYTGTPEVMATYAAMAIDAGAKIIGGCCGTRPEHLRAMRKVLDTHQRGEAPTIDEIVVKLGDVSDLAKGKAAGEKRSGGRRRARA